jgi:hypothetical protein
MNNLKNLSVKRKVIISLSLMWTVLSFIVAIYIIAEDGSSDVLENFLTSLISFLIFTAPVWMYWIALWIWGKSVEKLINNLLIYPLRKFILLSKNIIPTVRNSLRTIIFIFLIIAAALISRAVVKSVFKSFSDNKEVVKQLSDLGATEEAAKYLSTKIKNHKGFEYLWDEKSFRAIILRKTVSEINKETPTKIDELTYLIESSTDGDRTMSYKYKVNFTYDEGKKILDGREDAMYQDRKKYWCHDDLSSEFRKMKAIVVYEYFSSDMSPIGSYTINIGKDC